MEAKDINQSQTDAVRNFGQLTHAEQIEMIRLHAQGYDVELYVPAMNEFHWTRKPMWLDDCAYRIAL